MRAGPSEGDRFLRTFGAAVLVALDRRRIWTA